MAIENKYRAHELAKDFKITLKEVSEILMSKTGATKVSRMYSLNETELNIFFEHMTQSNQAENLEELLSAKKQKQTEQKQDTKKQDEQIEKQALKEEKPAEQIKAHKEENRVEQKPLEQKL